MLHSILLSLASLGSLTQGTALSLLVVSVQDQIQPLISTVLTTAHLWVVPQWLLPNYPLYRYPRTWILRVWGLRQVLCIPGVLNGSPMHPFNHLLCRYHRACLPHLLAYRLRLLYCTYSPINILCTPRASYPWPLCVRSLSEDFVFCQGHMEYWSTRYTSGGVNIQDAEWLWCKKYPELCCIRRYLD